MVVKHRVHQQRPDPSRRVSNMALTRETLVRIIIAMQQMIVTQENAHQQSTATRTLAVLGILIRQIRRSRHEKQNGGQ